MTSQRRKDGTFHNLRANKWREVRDLYNKLYREFKRELVIQFLETQYFINAAYLEYVMREVDSQPVTNGSIVYQAAIKPGFDIRPYIKETESNETQKDNSQALPE